ncbi:ABC transporter ATP-binding protein [Auritidibacter sp. NML100628]|uniref:ABC transporter ATP-binding protein n=1 Tax=Auritidibacter sp. NML100628 TaxID=2170742 RepID=UPI000D7365D0|nr:ABC transporter ATP-binding protein [Auritidibacter sp. NML100628]PXA75861.1 ABC transporter ATP-binding protein [Auritidibacter sp. NML100628]
MLSSTPPSQPLLLEAITKTFQRGAVAANDAISLTLHPGQLIALIGHNGAGKTTLLNQIVGTAKPTSGDIRYGTESLAKNPDLARRIASMMPQMHAPLTGVTPRQAITSIGRLRGLSGRDARCEASALINELDITPWQNVGGEKLSGGLRRLTSYAMAVIAPPPVLLIDEPTNDVDPTRRPLIWRNLRQLANAGHIIIVVTHNLLEVQRTADRYVLLQNGQVLIDSTPRQLSQQAQTTSLSVSVRSRTALTKTPSASRVHPIDDGQLRLDLEPQHIPGAVAWVLEQVEAGNVDSYVLAPASLESLYEGITNVR